MLKTVILKIKMIEKPKYKNGDYYVVDKDFANGGKVKLIGHGKYYATVQDPNTGAIWVTISITK